MTDKLTQIATQLRRWVLESTTAAGSGHPTSCLSAVEAVTALFFGGTFRAHLADPHYPTNDLFVLSKGHAAPLLYAVYAAAGVIDPIELSTLRRRGSQLEGHPTADWPYTAVATGSLGQGLAAGLGLALDARWRELPRRVFVLLGDGEMLEGSNSEAMILAAHEGVANLVAAVDINGLGQRGATIWEKDLTRWKMWVESLGWRCLVARDGHDLNELTELWSKAVESDGRPTMLLLPTVKGQGVSFLAGDVERHGKALSDDELAKALEELPLSEPVVAEVASPPDYQSTQTKAKENKAASSGGPTFAVGDLVATREAIAQTVADLAGRDERIAVLDAEVGNSTYFNEAMAAAPGRSLECYIAEQAMVGVAVGLARSGRQPWLATFAAFLSRAADQLRMAPYSNAGLKIVGTHVGVSIGQDGPSQMGLEDVSLFRSVGAQVLCPSDAVSAVALTRLVSEDDELTYLRAARGATPVIYEQNLSWRVGGSQVLRQSDMSLAVVVAAGVTVHEALVAADDLAQSGLAINVIDAYSIQPLDVSTICRSAAQVGLVVVVEDHRPAGGLGEAVAMALTNQGVAAKVIHLAVRNQPGSATPAEQLHLSEIDADAIKRAIVQNIRSNKER